MHANLPFHRTTLAHIRIRIDVLHIKLQLQLQKNVFFYGSSKCPMVQRNTEYPVLPSNER